MATAPPAPPTTRHALLRPACFPPPPQAALLRTDEAFDLVVDGLEAVKLPAARRAAALCLRNLAFCAEGKACFLAKPRALPALLTALGGADLRLCSYASAALWALLCRSEKAKVALRGARLLQQLQQAEKALAARAMEPAAPAPPGARDDLNAALKNLDAVGWLLGLDGMQLRFGAAGP